MIFAVLAAFVMSLSFTACSGGGPEDKFLSAMEDAVALLKDTHIKSADDVAALKSKMEGIKKSVEAAQSELMESVMKMTPEEIEKFGEKVEKKAQELSAQGETESKRIIEEAKAVGIDESELDFLD